MKKLLFGIIIPGIAVAAAGLLITYTVKAVYFYYFLYAILQMVAISSAWNILGGYTGYINFGVAGFFAAGAYTSIVLLTKLHVPLPVAMLGSAVVGGLLGLVIGYLSIRVRGIYFGLSTIAFSLLLQVIVLNSKFFGGAMGFKIVRPPAPAPFSKYIQLLFLIILLISFLAIAISRIIEKSWVGRGFLAIKDSENAAETSGIGTLNLKLTATVVSCSLVALAGAPYPYFISFLEPYSAMSLTVGVYVVASVFVGGRGVWYGPLIGAFLMGGMQQYVTLKISSAWNIFVVGVLIVAFVILVPHGVAGYLKLAIIRIKKRMRERGRHGVS